jgi:DNA-binding transcriptional regulator YiaG
MDSSDLLRLLKRVLGEEYCLLAAYSDKDSAWVQLHSLKSQALSLTQMPSNATEDAQRQYTISALLRERLATSLSSTLLTTAPTDTLTTAVYKRRSTVLATFGDMVRQLQIEATLRIRRKLSTSKAAKEMGVGYSTIREWKRMMKQASDAGIDLTQPEFADLKHSRKHLTELCSSGRA